MTPIETLNVIVGFARTFRKTGLETAAASLGGQIAVDATLLAFVAHAAKELGLPTGAIDLALLTICESGEEAA